MKKFLVFFLVLSLIISFAAAEEDDDDNDDDDENGFGITTGLETGVEDAGNKKRVPYLMPLFIYENSFFNDSFDVFAELNYFACFGKSPDRIRGKFEQYLILDLMAGYNLRTGNANSFSFILQNEFDEMVIYPGFSLDGVLTPAVKFTGKLGFGDIFAKIGAPIYYFNYAGPEFGLDFTLGWCGTFGLEIEAKLLTLLAPGDDAGYNGFEALVSYENGPVYFEVEVEIPREISEEGVIITPEFEYSFGRWSVYANCEFSGIGAGGGASFSPGVGVKFTF